MGIFRCTYKQEVRMKKNVGSVDRIVRIIAGLIIAGLGFTYKQWWGLIAIIPIATALIGWCPAYLPFGIKTCKTDSKS